MSERYINNLTGDFSICFSEHLTEHPSYLLKKLDSIADWLSYEEQIAYYQAKIEELRRHKDE